MYVNGNAGFLRNNNENNHPQQFVEMMDKYMIYDNELIKDQKIFENNQNGVLFENCGDKLIHIPFGILSEFELTTVHDHCN